MFNFQIVQVMSLTHEWALLFFLEKEWIKTPLIPHAFVLYYLQDWITWCLMLSLIGIRLLDLQTKPKHVYSIALISPKVSFSKIMGHRRFKITEIVRKQKAWMPDLQTRTSPQWVCFSSSMCACERETERERDRQKEIPY